MSSFFDRYIYDEMANLPLTNPLTRLWVQIVRLIAPQPDLALLLDADPEEARAASRVSGGLHAQMPQVLF